MQRLLSALRVRRLQFVVAAAIVVSASTMAAIGVWVFHEDARGASERSVWRILLSDASTVGFARLAIVALSIYAAVSVGALIADGRWIRSVTPGGGFEADDAREAKETVADLKARVERAEEARDEAFRLVWRLLRG